MSLDKNYVYIRDGIVVNTVIFNDPSQELLDFFIAEQQLDAIILADKHAVIGASYDGVKFMPPCPSPSWEWELVTEVWMPPVEYPNDGKFYRWDEATTSWIEVTE
jgi:hypothetical protein